MKKRVALCLRGGVGRQKAHIRRPNELDDYPYDINNNHHYIKKEACYNSIKKHIIDSNPEYDFDVFIHCWEVVLEKDMVELYKPKLYKFEDNTLYKEEILAKIKEQTKTMYDFSQCSHALSTKKCMELKEVYEKTNNFVYDTVILYRPDVLLWKDMILSRYLSNNIYVNRWSAGPLADFHFVMSSENATKIKWMYDDINKLSPSLMHTMFNRYITGIMKQNLLMDDIDAGIHQEVCRKIKWPLYVYKSITLDKLLDYNLSEDDIKDYHPPDTISSPGPAI